MTTKRVEIALFQYTGSKYGFTTTWTREPGKSGERADYVRISEWVEVDFPMLPVDAVAETAAREIAVKRERLLKELAELEGAK